MSLLSCPPEVQFVALRNIELIAQRDPALFAKDARVFIVHKYPRRFEGLLVALCETFCDLSEPFAKAAFVWLLGEYTRIGDAEASLETLVELFESEEHVVQLQLLTTTVKLFLKRPRGAKVLVQRVLRVCGWRPRRRRTQICATRRRSATWCSPSDRRSVPTRTALRGLSVGAAAQPLVAPDSEVKPV